MINELYDLSRSLKAAGIEAPTFHRKLKAIPNISKKAPCVRIVVSEGRILALEPVPEKAAAFIRKYGDNQGSFPGMNLAPLFRLTKEEQKKTFEQSLKKQSFEKEPASYADWMSENNWNTSFLNKLRISLKDRAEEVQSLLGTPSRFEDAMVLIAETRAFADTNLLRDEMLRVCLSMLEKGENPELALRILFYSVKSDEKSEKDHGSLSVVFDSVALTYSTIGRKFTEKLNQALLESDTQEETGSDLPDAFHHRYTPDNNPFPTVKLAAGLTVSLRTMNSKPIPALTRYGQGGNDTYALSDEVRKSAASALTWIGGSAEDENILWTRTGVKDEALFVYSSSFGVEPVAFARLFNRSKVTYEAESEEFMKRLLKWKENEADTYPEMIQLFFLRKINKACSKVVYSCQTNPDELMKSGEKWKQAARNIPYLSIPRPFIPFPLEIAAILNRLWAYDGGPVKTDKYRPVSSYHGVQLQFELNRESVRRDLHLMVQSVEKQAVSCGAKLNGAGHRTLSEQETDGLRESVVMIGMCLYWLNIRKEEYMHSYPYLLGQLLKVADGLHENYCYGVRDGQLPPQLAGSSFYISASETPKKALAQLGLRMTPYISWAKTHRDYQLSYTGADGKTQSSPPAAWYLRLFEDISAELYTVLSDDTRFNDCQKAELFLGYIAAFPKKTKDDKTTEEGGKEHEL